MALANSEVRAEWKLLKEMSEEFLAVMNGKETTDRGVHIRD